MPKKIDPLPNFLIVGAAKSGTTSLYHYLKQHPDVFMPDWKEPAFFAPPEAGGIQDEAEYRALFKGAVGKKAIGEASVAYLYAPEAAQKIYDFLGPETKIVILLRNPVDMAYSLWGHQVREGYEDLSFEDAWKTTPERLLHPAFSAARHSWYGDFDYINRPRYALQIERYQNLFPPENIQVFIFEEFFKKGLPQFSTFCRFLGVDENFVPPNERHNAAGEYRSKRLRDIVRKPAGWKAPLKAIIPSEIRLKLRDFIDNANRTDAPLPSLDPQTRKMLEREFEPGVRALEKIIHRDLQDLWW